MLIDRIDKGTGVSAPIGDGLKDASGIYPGETTYEILAFSSVAAAMPVGTKYVATFDVNVNIGALMKREGKDADARASHSCQIHHDIFTTRSVWKTFLAKTSLIEEE